jgi:tRNA A-37 threonylcarbamoyl transferase component Bud32
MEFVSSVRPIAEAEGRNEHGAQWAMMAARKLMELFHAKDWVHGNLWDANILRGRERLKLVDLDFGGMTKRVILSSCASPSRALFGTSLAT